MKNHIEILAGVLVVGLFAANHASAQNLPPPVSGLEILNLAGSPISGGPVTYGGDFVATSANSTVTFVFRHDPGFFYMDNASVVDSTTPAGNLLVNGDFSAPAPAVPGGGAPGWTYFIQAGNLFPGYLGYENGGVWYDGATQAYDGIDQTFATTSGDTYHVSFDLSETGANVTTYREISNNGNTTTIGGNGIDVVLYAGNGLPPTTVPDAGSALALMATALAGLCGFARRFRK